MMLRIASNTNKHFSKRLLHTFVPWVCQKDAFPTSIKRGEGINLFTEDGKKIKDFTSGLMFANVGHGNKYVQDGMIEHINNGISHVRYHISMQIYAFLCKESNYYLF